MSDPKLKLPLRVLPKSIGTGFLAVADDDGHLIHLTKHHAEVIVAALTADAEKAANPPRVIARSRPAKPDAEKETRGE